jgi:hypothetical protein
MKQALRTAPLLANALKGLTGGGGHRSGSQSGAGGGAGAGAGADAGMGAGTGGGGGTGADAGADIESGNGAPPPSSSGSAHCPSSPLVLAIISNCADPTLSQMEASIMAVITESTSFSKCAAEMRHQVRL